MAAVREGRRYLAARLLDLDDAAIVQRFTGDADQIFPGFGAQVREAHVRRWPLGPFYTETAITTGWRAADSILAQSGP